MAKFPLIEDNLVVDRPGDPSIAWSIRTPYTPTLSAIERLTAWCEANGLNICAIPAEAGGLVVRLESPDGGLIADLVEFELDDRGWIKRDPGSDGKAFRRTRRTVPVDSIPPVLGLIPTWAAAMTNTNDEETR
jgi:hypothetical protein